MKKGYHGPLAQSGNTPPPDFHYDPPADDGLQIIHHDDDILVISKPSGLLSVSGKAAELHDSLETRITAEFPSARIVHRLDMDTSGLMVLACNAKAHRHLGLQFEKRKADKTYIAIVASVIEKNEGTIELPLRTDWYNKPKQMVDHALGREAITDWKVLERRGKATRVSLSPKTGRTHQLRVHMAEFGHPILGDVFYGGEANATSASRLMLHAETLEIHHPSDGRRCKFEDLCLF